MSFGIFEASVASEQETGLARQAAVDNLNAAVYDVREKLGSFLFQADSLEEFRDRVAMIKNDQSVFKVIGEHLMPVTGVVRRIVGKNGILETEFKRLSAAEKTAAFYKGAPFAGYKDFDACTAANSDKDDPDAYCGYIKHKVEDKTGNRQHTAALESILSRRDLTAAFHELTRLAGFNDTHSIIKEFETARDTAQRSQHPDDHAYMRQVHREIVDRAMGGDPHAKAWIGREPGSTDADKAYLQYHRDTGHTAARYADFTGTVDTDSTFDPSEGLLKPEGDFKGYQKDVAQNPHGKQDDLFVKGGPPNKHDKDPAKTLFARHGFSAYRDWCDANGLSVLRLSSLDRYAVNLSDAQYIALASAIQACDEMTTHHPKIPSTKLKGKDKVAGYWSDLKHDLTRPMTEEEKLTQQETGNPFYPPPRKEPGTRGDPTSVLRKEHELRDETSWLPGHKSPADESGSGLGGAGSHPEDFLGIGTLTNKALDAWDRHKHRAGSRADGWDHGHYPRKPSTKLKKTDKLALRRYIAWCDANGLARLSAVNIDWYARGNPRLAYFLGWQAKRAIRTARLRYAKHPNWYAGNPKHDWFVKEHPQFTAPYSNHEIKDDPFLSAAWPEGHHHHHHGSRRYAKDVPYLYTDEEAEAYDPESTRIHQETMHDTSPGRRNQLLRDEYIRRQRQRSSSRRYAQPDYLQKADDALTQLLNSKAEDFQNTIAPLQQALVTVQKAQQLQQAQNPMNVMPQPGSINVMPPGGGDQGAGGGAPPPGGGGGDTDALAAMLAGGGGGGAPGGAPPGGGPPGGGAPPPGGGGGPPPQQMQASMRYAGITRQMMAMAMSRKHYRQMADLIKDLPPEHKGPLAEGMANMFKADNSNFSHSKWYAAVGHDPNQMSRAAWRRGGGWGKASGAVRPRQAGSNTSVFNLWDKWQHQRGEKGNLGIGGEADYEAFANEMGVGSDALKKLRRYHAPHLQARRRHAFDAAESEALRKRIESRPFSGLGGRPPDDWQRAPVRSAPKAKRSGPKPGETLDEYYARTGSRWAGRHEYRPEDPDQIFAPEEGYGWEHASKPSGPPYVRPQLEPGRHKRGRWDQAEGFSFDADPYDEGEAASFDMPGGHHHHRHHRGATDWDDVDWDAPRRRYPEADNLAQQYADRYRQERERQRKGHHKTAWSGWGPALFPKVRQVPGWNWDKHLNGYLANQNHHFACDCGESFPTPTGFRVCGSCGKQWNSYVIGTGGSAREASAEKFLVREIPLRAEGDVIVASRRRTGGGATPDVSGDRGGGGSGYGGGSVGGAQASTGGAASGGGPAAAAAPTDPSSSLGGHGVGGVLAAGGISGFLSKFNPFHHGGVQLIDPRTGAIHNLLDLGELGDGEDDGRPTFKKQPRDWARRGDGARFVMGPAPR